MTIQKEPTILMYIRLPKRWHNELKMVSVETNQTIAGLLRPYIRIAIKEIKEKYNKGEAI